jgi:hypothetical protein
MDCNGVADDGCEASMLDPATCGSCSNACPVGQVCTATGCATACGVLETKMPNGSCVNTTQCDPGNCPSPWHGVGACSGNACTIICDAGYTLCGDQCVDTQHDPWHCGGCNSCPSELRSGAMACVDGICTPRCPAGFTLCPFSEGIGAVDRGSICVDLQTDLSNCGQCGVVCATGLCVGGVCDAKLPRVLVTGLGGSTLLALDATNVFFADSGKGMIGRVAKTGGATQMLASGEPNVQGFAVDDTHVYWSSSVGNAIKRIPKGGGAIEVVSAASDPRALAVDGADVFWANHANGKLLKAPKQGGGPITQLSQLEISTAVLADVQLDGDYIYWEAGDPWGLGVFRMPKDGSASATYIMGLGGNMLAFDQDYVYAGTWDGFGVYRRRKDLSEPAFIATVTGGGDSHILTLAVAGIFTYSDYIGGMSSGRALKCGGLVPIHHFSRSPFGFGTPVVTDGAHLYTVVGYTDVGTSEFTYEIERLPL